VVTFYLGFGLGIIGLVFDISILIWGQYSIFFPFGFYQTENRIDCTSLDIGHSLTCFWHIYCYLGTILTFFSFGFYGTENMIDCTSLDIGYFMDSSNQSNFTSDPAYMTSHLSIKHDIKLMHKFKIPNLPKEKW